MNHAHASFDLVFCVDLICVYLLLVHIIAAAKMISLELEEQINYEPCTAGSISLLQDLQSLYVLHKRKRGQSPGRVKMTSPVT